MTGLREMKKREMRQRIIDQAKRMFGEKGFTRTTTADIAREANIGEGTLFNYFRSKGELYIAAVFEGYRPDKYVPSTLITVNERTLANETLSLLKHYLQVLSGVDKRTIREYFATLYGNSVESTLLWETAIKADEVAIESLQEFYESLKASNKLPGSFDTKLAVSCIYGFAITQSMVYVYSERYMFDDLMRDMEQAIRFILHGHLSDE